MSCIELYCVLIDFLTYEVSLNRQSLITVCSSLTGSEARLERRQPVPPHTELLEPEPLAVRRLPRRRRPPRRPHRHLLLLRPLPRRPQGRRRQRKEESQRPQKDGRRTGTIVCTTW